MGLMDDADVQTRKWTRLEYDRLVEAEFFRPDDRIELLGGHIVVKEPQYSPHAVGISRVQRVLEATFGPGWYVRVQMPVALDDESEPEPDLSVVPGEPDDYLDAHPSSAVLLVEVGQSLCSRAHRGLLDREHPGPPARGVSRSDSRCGGDVRLALRAGRRAHSRAARDTARPPGSVHRRRGAPAESHDAVSAAPAAIWRATRCA